MRDFFAPCYGNPTVAGADPYSTINFLGIPRALVPAPFRSVLGFGFEAEGRFSCTLSPIRVTAPFDLLTPPPVSVILKGARSHPALNGFDTSPPSRPLTPLLSRPLYSF